MTQLIKKTSVLFIALFALNAMAGLDEVQAAFTELNGAINDGDRHGVVTKSMVLIVATQDAQEGASHFQKGRLKEMNRIANRLANDGYNMPFAKIETLFGQLFVLLDELLGGDQSQ